MLQDGVWQAKFLNVLIKIVLYYIIIIIIINYWIKAGFSASIYILVWSKNTNIFFFISESEKLVARHL